MTTLKLGSLMRTVDIKGQTSLLPVVRLSNIDGNAFAILAACIKAARQSHWTTEQLNEFLREAKSGDYDTLLAVVEKFFEVV